MIVLHIHPGLQSTCSSARYFLGVVNLANRSSPFIGFMLFKLSC